MLLVSQISIMLFLIRETLIVNWGRGNISILKGENKTAEAPKKAVKSGETSPAKKTKKET
jgi:hypothetical protein